MNRSHHADHAGAGRLGQTAQRPCADPHERGGKRTTDAARGIAARLYYRPTLAYTLLCDEDAEEAKVGELGRVHGSATATRRASVNIDELAIGFTLGFLDVPLAPVLIAIAVQAFVVSQLEMRLGARVREGAERLAGLVRARSRSD